MQIAFEKWNWERLRKMEIEEIIFRVKKNKMTKVKGVTFISDFLGTTKEEARNI